MIEWVRARWPWFAAAGLVAGFLLVQAVGAFPICTAPLVPCIDSEGGFVFDETLGALVSEVFGIVLGLLGDLVRGMADVVIDWLLATLPDADPLGTPSFAGVLVGYAWMNQWVPLDAGLSVASLILAVTASRFLLQLLITVRHLLPFI